MELGRRAFAGILGAAGAGALAGCSSLTGDGGRSEETVTATEPNADGEGTLGELRYLIETKQGENDRAIQLTRMATGTASNDDGEFTYVTATYDSQASDRGDFINEVGVFARSYATYVGAGGEAATDFTVTVADGYDGQPSSFGIARAWARRYNAGEMSGNQYIGNIVSTFEETTTGSGANTSIRGDKL
ncbi:hypothetical protein [Salarchaeum japonicum]|uniref:DUF8159 domain-containing protein n=1 Tax=Salarchaeum japonicum TaxID=555573 RepID=A0AAV3T1M6_9EURY|nr:hypothetical protein [Salarchaeum japonicum]